MSSTQHEEADKALHTEFAKAKAFLLKDNALSKRSLYSHLVEVLQKILSEQPDNALDIFESISQDVKHEYQVGTTGTEPELKSEDPLTTIATMQKPLFVETTQQNASNPDAASIPDIASMAFRFEQVGVSISQEAAFEIDLALNHLSESHSFQELHFWGKILGLENDYIIAEAISEEDMEMGDEELGMEPSREENADESLENQGMEWFDIIPKPKYTPPPEVPPEETGIGINMYCYFVCSPPEMNWRRLPQVRPKHIVAARQIRKFFTGRLDAKVESCFPFPGEEAHYLRAQIARISASCCISPLEYFTLEEFSEEEEGTMLSIHPTTQRF